MTGIAAFLETLACAGVRHIFGNPGTTELPLNAALARDHRFQYVFGAHEIPVMAMADGYAMASGGVGVVNVHIACGLGNAMGMLYNAHVEGTPLLLTAGQQDRRLQLSGPVLQADLVSCARPWTKWAYEVQRVEDVSTATRRAIQIALTPPRGPVFLSLPVDVQMEEVANPEITAPCLADSRIRPPRAALERAANLLRQARNPVILAGSRVTEADAVKELVAVADRLGATVFAESTSSHGRLPMPTDHPLYRSILPLWAPDIHETLRPFDVILAVGTNLFRLYIYREPARPMPENARLIQMDNLTGEVGKNFPAEVGLVGDIQCGLAELNELLESGPANAQSAERRRACADRRLQEQTQLRRDIDAASSARPLPALGMMGALARVLPANVAIVEEAITSHRNVLERLGVLQDARGFFAHRGWALGWGMGCALGVKLAWPDRPVLALIGDGAAMYGIQALWSAAHHGVAVTFVIANNSRYQILQDCGDVMGLPTLREASCPGMAVRSPLVDFVGLARALGVEARRLTEPDELSDTIRTSLAGDRPMLVEVPIA